MGNVDYKVLKNNIIKSCTGSEKGTIKFNVNFDKLSTSVDDIGLRLLNIGMKSKKVDLPNIIALSEYFKGPKLSWFSEEKECTTLVFVLAEAVDERCEELLKNLDTSPVDDPEIDHVKTLATIIAEYPCYCAAIVSYMSNEPKRFGRPSYEIKIRANTVAIKQQLYNYIHDDMV